MNNTLVLDTSIMLSWFIKKEAHPYAVSVRKAIENGMRVLTPATWTLDVAYQLKLAERKGIIKEGHINQAMNLLSKLPIRSQVQLSCTALNPIIRTTQSENMNVYDTPYLELALSKNLPLATVNETLRRIAEKLGILLFEQ